jgi:hypothetical protein
MPTKELSGKPAKVVLAVKMLYLVVGLGIVRTAVTVIRHADVRSPYFLIFMKLLFIAVSLFLIYQVGKAKNWARWSLVVILGCNLPLTILPAFESIFHSPVHSLLMFLQVVFYIVALVLLFHKSSSNWFGTGKVS